MFESERRKSKRLPAKFDLLCSTVGLIPELCCKGQTVNVSSCGLYFETADDIVFDMGSLLKVELSIPPTSGELEIGGRISTLARVVRTCDKNTSVILLSDSDCRLFISIFRI